MKKTAAAGINEIGEEDKGNWMGTTAKWNGEIIF
jgi:hypothetical protein